MKKRVGVMVFILYLPSVVALDTENFKSAFNNIGMFIRDVLQNEYALYGIVFILLMILLRSIFVAGLKRLPLFEGAGGEGVNKLGQMIGWTLAALCTIGLFRYKGDTSISGFMSGVLGPAGFWIGLGAALIIFLWLRKQFGENTRWALFFTGLACIVIDAIFNVGAMSLIGFLLIIIALFWIFWGMGHSRENPGYDIRREEREQRGIRGLLDWWRRRGRRDVRKEEEIVEEGKKLEGSMLRLRNLLKAQFNAIRILVLRFKALQSYDEPHKLRVIAEEKTNLTSLLKEERKVLEREIDCIEEETKRIKEIESRVKLFKRLLRLIHRLKIDEKRLKEELKDKGDEVIETEKRKVDKELRDLKYFVRTERLKHSRELEIEREEGEIKGYDKKALGIVKKGLDFMEKEFDKLFAGKSYDEIVEELVGMIKSIKEREGVYADKEKEIARLENLAKIVRLIEVDLMKRMVRIEKFIGQGIIPIEEEERRFLEQFRI